MSKVATRYAKSLFDLANEKNLLDQCREKVTIEQQTKLSVQARLKVATDLVELEKRKAQAQQLALDTLLQTQSIEQQNADAAKLEAQANQEKLSKEQSENEELKTKELTFRRIN